jgi:hypothetical protein
MKRLGLIFEASPGKISLRKTEQNETKQNAGTVVHTCYPSYLEDIGRRIKVQG